jgi:hypothetical protein
MANLDEAEGGMKAIGGRIGRVRIDLADHAIVAGGDGGAKQIFVQAVRHAALAHRRSDDDAVDIDEAREAFAEPEVVGAVVVGVLVEGQEEGGDVAGAAGMEGLPQEAPQLRGVEPRELYGMLVVEREDGGLLAD